MIVVTKRPSLIGLQALRGGCALVVTCAHLPWLDLPVGGAGVDVFFVISGFIMMFACRDGMPAAEFLRARFVRIVPFYWLMILVSAPVWTDPSVGRVIATTLFWPTQDSRGWWLPAVGQGWTLTYEILFYAGVAVVLPLPARARALALTAAAAALCLVQAVSAPAAFGTLGISASAFVEFVMGVWLYLIWRTGRLRGCGLSYCVLGCLAIAMTLAQPAMPWRVIVWGIPALCIVTGALLLEGRALRLAARLSLLGDASFSIYLVHPLVIHMFIPLVKPLPLPLALMALVAACAVVGIVVHYWVEQPIVAWAGRRVGLPELRQVRQSQRRAHSLAVSGAS